MVLQFHPPPGTLLICDYSSGFQPPEMVKRRPVVVLSPRLRRRDGLVTVVPLSTTAPQPPCAHHCEIVLERALPKPFDSLRMWAKCDMLATVGFARLDRFRIRHAHGRRSFSAPVVGEQDFRAIQRAVLHALGLGSLTIHLP